MRRIYCDTSFLLALYLDCQFTAVAVDIIKRVDTPLALNALQKLEITNGIMRSAFTKTISPEQACHVRLRFDKDIESGFYQLDPGPTPSVFEIANKLSIKHALTMGNHSLGILHVSCALLGKARHFLTFDARQQQLAKAEGLKPLA